MMIYLKVLVGCPVSDFHEYSTKQYIEAIKKLTYSNYDVVLADNSKNGEFYKKLKTHGLNVIRMPYSDSAKIRIVDSRNALRDIVLDKNYDYFLSLEQDVIPPFNIIEKLIQHRKDAVSGVYFNYFQDVEEPIPLAFVETNIKDYSMRAIKDEELNSGKLIKITASGLGCVLISRKVLEKVKFRIDAKKDTFDDMPFCEDLEKNNFDLYLDTSVKCVHLLKNRPWKWSELEPSVNYIRFVKK